MMFCEKCNFLVTDDRCPLCGSKRLRAAQDRDFCFFIQMDGFHFSMLEGVLQENDIEVVGVPCYSRGVTYGIAGRADGRKVYIRYKDMDRAKELYQTIFGLDE